MALNNQLALSSIINLKNKYSFIETYTFDRPKLIFRQTGSGYLIASEVKGSI